MGEVLDLCQRLEASLSRIVPQAVQSLQPGATARQLDAFEKHIGRELPEQLRDFYGWRNGQERYPAVGFLLGCELLCVDDAMNEWSRWQPCADMNEEIGEGLTCQPEGAVLPAYSLPGWIPFAQWPAISNYIGVDLNPGPAGVVGQVIPFGRDDTDKAVGGASLSDCLAFLVEELEEGRIVFFSQPNFPTFYSHSIRADVFLPNMWWKLHEMGVWDGRRFDYSRSS